MDSSNKAKKALSIKTGLLPIYEEKHLPKINSMRKALSETSVENVTAITRGQALFSPASDSLNQPRSCYNCRFYTEPSCTLLGKNLKIKKFTYGEPFKEIEYWPVCGMWAPIGHDLDPDFVDLCWINAPKLSDGLGGSSCGGRGNGDDCDAFEVDMNVYTDKRDAPFGTCKKLRTMVYNGDCCSLWEDDDVMSWQKAQDLIGQQEKSK